MSEINQVLEVIKKTKYRQGRRYDFIRNIYFDYCNPEFSHVLIFDMEKEDKEYKKSFYYFIDKGYLTIINSSPNSIEYRITSEGIDYIESVRMKEMNERLTELRQ